MVNPTGLAGKKHVLSREALQRVRGNADYGAGNGAGCDLEASAEVIVLPNG